MNLAYLIHGNDIVIMTVEKADIRQGYMEIVGYMNEKSCKSLNKFSFVTVKMEIEAVDGKLEYVYRLNPRFTERLSRENGLSKVMFLSTEYTLVSSEVFR
jgi:hypothetical protein